MDTLVGAGALRLAAVSSHPGQAETDDTRLADGPLREVLIKHLPNHDGTACSTCGFAYSAELPLCPPVAHALGELAASDFRLHKSPLRRYTTSRLRALVREHSGEGRCRRCGFVYSGQVRICPTARRITLELESRHKAPVTPPREGQGLCAGKGSGWNVTGHKAAPWKRAMAACSICPLLAQCEAELENRLAAGTKICEQVMAGRLFTVKGVEIAPHRVDAFAAQRGRTKKKRPRSHPIRPASTNKTPALPATDRQLELVEEAAV